MTEEINGVTLKKGMSVTHLFQEREAHIHPVDTKHPCTEDNPCPFCRKQAEKDSSSKVNICQHMV